MSINSYAPIVPEYTAGSETIPGRMNRNSIDTTTKSTACTYDRIILTNQAKTDFTGNSGVFRFDNAYNLTYDMTIAVSDHYPVYAEFWNNRDAD